MDQSKGGIYIVDPLTGQAEAVTSEELAALQARAPEPQPEPVKPAPAPRKQKEDLTDATQN